MDILSSILGSIMSFSYKLVNNYGLAIILFTLFSKIILLPISIWVQFNSIKMVKMEPELNRIKIDNYGDKDAIAEETQKLYKKNHYHALASIIPLLIQIILLIGVVSVIYHPMNYILNVDETVIERFEEVAINNDSSINPESNSIQINIAKQIQSGNTSSYLNIKEDFSNEDINSIINNINNLKMNFLGIDLSWIPSVDKGISIIVPLIAGLSAYLLSFFQNRINVLQATQSKISNYLTMALSIGISLFLGFFVPSGVALYWIASNLLTILQQYFLNKVINPKKYVNWEDLESSRKELESLNEYSKKTKKKDDPNNIRCKEDYKKFLSLGNKHLVFYSEANGFYKYYAGTIKWLLENTNIPIHYITSDPNDNIFTMAKENSQIIPYYIDSQKLITLMMRMDADVVVMTMPDLETYQIKRSYVKKDVEYIYVPHAINSLNLVMRYKSMDYFDVILSVGKHQTEEVEATQKLHNIENQTIVEAGYPLLDDLYSDYKNMPKDNKTKTVLIAPSYQKDNIIDSCLDEMLEKLNDKDYKIIVRPHPQYIRRKPEKIEKLKEKYINSKNIEIQTDFSSNKTVYMADMLITDWSSIGFEYAFATLKPVLFIDTPMKVANPNYKELDIEPFNIWMREKIGGLVDLNDVDSISTRIDDLLSNKEKYENIIKEYRNDYVYNFTKSGEVSGKFIAREVLKKIAIRKDNENA